jgi:hypothetical protein
MLREGEVFLVMKFLESLMQSQADKDRLDAATRLDLQEQSSGERAAMAVGETRSRFSDSQRIR